VNGCATGAVSVPLAAIIANRWFVRRRGLVTGVLTASNDGVAPGPGGIRSGTPGTVACRPAADLLAAGRDLLRLRSDDYGAHLHPPDPCGPRPRHHPGDGGLPPPPDRAVRHRRHAGVGLATDRFDSRALLVVYYGLRGLALLALPVAFGSEHAALIAFAVVYGLDWVATVPPTSALTTSAFGAERAGVAFAWIFAAHQLGAALAPSSGRFVRDATGEYGPVFIRAGALAR